MIALKAKSLYNRKDKFSEGIILIKDDKIIEVRKNQDNSIPEGSELIDLDDAVILPGFIDAHTHWVQTSLETTFVDLSTINTMSRILERIKEESKRARNKEILVFKNLRYDSL
jgi:predicted amidohydrolase YtcJ